ncbi:hypothetical protein B9Z19DRAFT_1141167 [Tuber borchii]|uniref:Uncharacterized protein n=1 Tax=Tuber borchii TaxID=42251 RepID=A0A2T6ZTH9_TUBBO|nr:hypothetical protein B9Z19DRAFT_1141167 [Tuber borchii]
MFRFVTQFPLNRQPPIARYLTMTTPRPGIPNISKTSVKFGLLKKLLFKGKEPVSVDQAATPPKTQSDKLKTYSGVEGRVYRMEDKVSEFAQAIKQFDGGVAAIMLQNGVLLATMVGAGGVRFTIQLLGWFIKEQLSGNPTPEEVERMIMKATKNQGLKITA